MITDAQVHLWLKKPGDPAPTGSGTEQRPSGHGPEDMVAEMELAGVDRVVIVPPGALCSNTEAQGFCDAYPDRFAVMGAFDPRAAERHPGLTLIIDHMARPSRAAGIGSWADIDDLLRLG